MNLVQRWGGDIVLVDAITVCDDGLFSVAPSGSVIRVNRELRPSGPLQRSRGGFVLSRAVTHLLNGIPEASLPPPIRRGIVVGTMSGASPEILEFATEAARVGEDLVNPGLFPLTVHNAPAGLAAIVGKCAGASLTLAQGCGSSIAAIAIAADLLVGEKISLALAGGIESIGYGFSRIPSQRDANVLSICTLVCVMRSQFAEAANLTPRCRLVTVATLHSDTVEKMVEHIGMGSSGLAITVVTDPVQALKALGGILQGGMLVCSDEEESQVLMLATAQIPT